MGRFRSRLEELIDEAEEDMRTGADHYDEVVIPVSELKRLVEQREEALDG